MISLFNTNRMITEEEKLGVIPKFKEVASKSMKIILPAMIETFFVGLISMMDTMMVGGLGLDAIASVSLTNQPVYITICFFVALNIGLTAVVSRAKGANNQNLANRALKQVILLDLFLIAILTFICITFARPILFFCGARSDTIDNAVAYFRIVSVGLVFNGLKLSITAAHRGVGKTKISMITNITASIVNVGLNYILINGKFGIPALGVEGAALATVIGHYVAFIISICSIYHSNGYLCFTFKGFFKFDKEILQPLKNVGLSALAEQLLMRAGFLIFAIMIASLGTEKQGIHQVCLSINSLMFTLADGFAIGAAAVVGHRLGEKRKDLAKVYCRVIQVISVSTALVLFTFVVIFREWLVGLYIDVELEPNAYEYASKLMIVASIMLIPQNIQWVLTGVLRGSGDTKFTAMTSFISVTVVRPLFSFLLCYGFGFGLFGAWFGMVLDQLIRMTLNMWRFKSGKWAKESL